MHSAGTSVPTTGGPEIPAPPETTVDIQMTGTEMTTEPNPFDGRPEKFGAWLATVKAELTTKDFRNNAAKVGYIYQSLNETVQDQVRDIFQGAQEAKWWNGVLEKMLGRLSAIYNEKAHNRLKRIYQVKEITYYIRHFDKALSEEGAEDWPHDAKIRAFTRGLNQTIRDRLEQEPKGTLPTTYGEFKKFVCTMAVRQKANAAKLAQAATGQTGKKSNPTV